MLYLEEDATEQGESMVLSLTSNSRGRGSEELRGAPV